VTLAPVPLSLVRLSNLKEPEKINKFNDPASCRLWFGSTLVASSDEGLHHPRPVQFGLEGVAGRPVKNGPLTKDYRHAPPGSRGSMVRNDHYSV
jgi:hypothetical protein